MHTAFDPIALPGSGETPLAGSRIFETIAARLRRDWAASDPIRRKIEALGWSVQDTPGGKRLSDNREMRYNSGGDILRRFCARC
jgi:hypothetical protein